MRWVHCSPLLPPCCERMHQDSFCRIPFSTEVINSRDILLLKTACPPLDVVLTSSCKDSFATFKRRHPSSLILSAISLLPLRARRTPSQFIIIYAFAQPLLWWFLNVGFQATDGCRGCATKQQNITSYFVILNNQQFVRLSVCGWFRFIPILWRGGMRWEKVQKESENQQKLWACYSHVTFLVKNWQTAQGEGLPVPRVRGVILSSFCSFFLFRPFSFLSPNKGFTHKVTWAVLISWLRPPCFAGPHLLISLRLTLPNMASAALNFFAAAVLISLLCVVTPGKYACVFFFFFFFWGGGRWSGGCVRKTKSRSLMEDYLGTAQTTAVCDLFQFNLPAHNGRIIRGRFTISESAANVLTVTADAIGFQRDGSFGVHITQFGDFVSEQDGTVRLLCICRFVTLLMAVPLALWHDLYR